MGSAGRGGFRRRNDGIGAAGGARGRVRRTQSVGAAAAEKIPAAAEKSASAAEKVAGEGKRREKGLGNRLLRSSPLHSSKSAVGEHRESPKGFATRLRVFAGSWSCFSPG